MNMAAVSAGWQSITATTAKCLLCLWIKDLRHSLTEENLHSSTSNIFMLSQCCLL